MGFHPKLLPSGQQQDSGPQIWTSPCHHVDTTKTSGRKNPAEQKTRYKKPMAFRAVFAGLCEPGTDR